jgi:hypothetical protein
VIGRKTVGINELFQYGGHGRVLPVAPSVLPGHVLSHVRPACLIVHTDVRVCTLHAFLESLIILGAWGTYCLSVVGALKVFRACRAGLRA